MPLLAITQSAVQNDLPYKMINEDSLEPMNFEESLGEVEYKMDLSANLLWKQQQLECLRAVFQGKWQCYQQDLENQKLFRQLHFHCLHVMGGVWRKLNTLL